MKKVTVTLIDNDYAPQVYEGIKTIIRNDEAIILKGPTLEVHYNTEYVLSLVAEEAE